MGHNILSIFMSISNLGQRTRIKKRLVILTNSDSLLIRIKNSGRSPDLILYVASPINSNICATMRIRFVLRSFLLVLCSKKWCFFLSKTLLNDLIAEFIKIYFFFLYIILVTSYRSVFALCLRKPFLKKLSKIKELSKNRTLLEINSL